MFTGIVEALGQIRAIESRSGDKRFQFKVNALDLSDVKPGDSIAVNGVCLTVVALDQESFWADVSAETLRCSTLGQLPLNSPVNLEKALALGDRLGGHLVSGHVDGIGEVVSIKTEARSVCYRLHAPDHLARYIAHKGSICVDGTSLTVNEVHGTEFALNIIPVTQQKTLFSCYGPGSRVNLEVDLIARYLERLLLGDKAADKNFSGEAISLEFLKQHGFVRD